MKIKYLVTFMVRSFASCSAMIMHLAVAKTLELSEAGYFYSAFTLVTLLSVVCRLGFDEVVLKNVSTSWHSREFNKINSVYKTAIVSVFISSFAGIFLLNFCGFIMMKTSFFELGNIIIFMSPSLMFVSIYFLHAQMLQGRLETIRSTFVLGLVSQFVFSFLIIIFPVRYARVASLYFDISTFLAMLTGFIFWRNKDYVKWANAEYVNLKTSCIPLWVVAIMQQAIIWGGQIIATFLVPANEIAAFNVFQRVATMLQFFLLFASLVCSPKLAAYYAQGQLQMLQKLVYKVNISLIVISIFSVVIMGSSGYFLTEKFLGVRYVNHMSLFYILMLSQLFNTVMGFSFYILTMCGQEKILKSIIIKIFSVTMLGNIFAAYYFGIYGTAIVSFISLFVQNVLCIYSVKKEINVKMWNLSTYF